MSEEKKVNVQQEATQQAEQAKDVEAINRVIKGENDIFEKEYDIKELGLEFKIKVRFPNALEQGRIHAKTAIYLDGTNRFMPEAIHTAYHTLAMLQVVGIDVPKFLTNDEEIYNMNVFLMIGRDLSEWMDTFQF